MSPVLVKKQKKQLGLYSCQYFCVAVVRSRVFLPSFCLSPHLAPRPSRRRFCAVRRCRLTLCRKVLEQPNNVEVNLAFARRAIELEDFEAAVSAMERTLIGRAGLPLIRLELGMYLRLEAPELAEAYFSRFLKAMKSTMTRANAPVLLAETRDANARGSFAFTVSLVPSTSPMPWRAR